MSKLYTNKDLKIFIYTTTAGLKKTLMPKYKNKIDLFKNSPKK